MTLWGGCPPTCTVLEDLWPLDCLRRHNRAFTFARQLPEQTKILTRRYLPSVFPCLPDAQQAPCMQSYLMVPDASTALFGGGRMRRTETNREEKRQIRQGFVPL